ncbi:DUF6354 family protein [Streptomyces sp. NPDC057705]|uniref:DUF6354 family protein n=1 Tax=Streptomyces sp. NPDC057705 TaxID=3346222 RepID=UPI0036BFB2C3
MKARDRRLRVTAVRDGRADLVVEHDLGGQADRKTHASTAGCGPPLELIEDPADADPKCLALLAAVAGPVQRLPQEPRQLQHRHVQGRRRRSGPGWSGVTAWRSGPAPGGPGWARLASLDALCVLNDEFDVVGYCDHKT